LGEIVRAKRKSNFGNVIGQRKYSPRKRWTVPTLLLVALRERIRPVENVILVIVILLPVKYKLIFVKTQWFPYFLPVTYDVIDVNECFHDLMFVNRAAPPPPPPPALLRTIRRLFADYSSTIRGLFVLFVYYSRTIRTIRRLFALFASLF
jgi:hypothetical protein